MKKKSDERVGDHDQKKNRMMKKRNISRLGGSGLSLDVFANAKSKNNHYNPAIISMHLSPFVYSTYFQYLYPLSIVLCVY